MSALQDVENARTLQSLAGLVFATGVLTGAPNRPTLPIEFRAHTELCNGSTARVGTPSWTQNAWKAELRSRYDAMPQSAWFREAHENKSLGDPVRIA